MAALFDIGSINVPWESIIGVRTAKQRLFEALIMPVQHEELFTYYGKKRTKGVVLYGPPGCGKTLCAKAVATSLAKMATKDKPRAGGFISVKGPEMLDMYQGNSEKNMRQVFEHAAVFQRQHGYPCVIFFDEAEAILGVRRGNQHGGSKDQVVSAFLCEMDGMEGMGAIVLLATNKQDMLDPAVTRDGRCDFRIRVPRPSQQDCRDLFTFYLAQTVVSDDDDPAEVARICTEKIYSSPIFEVSFHEADPRAFTLGHLASGAMVSGMVERAKLCAIHRAIVKKECNGVTLDDVMTGVRQSYQEHLGFRHQDAIDEFAESLGCTVAGLRSIAKEP
ncbi:MAG: ATP-binding protein [Armatimonadota bacterium]